MEKQLDVRPDNFKDDLRFLGFILGETLKEQESEELFKMVEKIRQLSKKSRVDENHIEINELKSLVKNLTDKETLLLARAFSHFLNLANIADTHQFINSLRNKEEGAIVSQYNSLVSLIPRLLESGCSKDSIYQTIIDMKIDLVLTAHPTEVKRRTLIQKYRQISDILQEKK